MPLHECLFAPEVFVLSSLKVLEFRSHSGSRKTQHTLGLFQGFGLNPWSMYDVVFPPLKASFPSCVRDFNTPLCHSSTSYREQGAWGDVYRCPGCGHRACLRQIQMGKLGGSPWLEERLCGLGLSYSAVFPCGVITLWHSHTALRSGKFGVSPFSPINVPLPSFDIFKLT